MFNVGGYSLWMQCEGSGSPTIVFEAGLGGGHGAFPFQVSDIKDSDRLCEYDRAGTGKSDDRPMSASPSSAGAVADELDRLLTGAGIAGPVVLVGHSFGGAVEQVYADRHGSNVAGLVFVDPVIAATALAFGRTWEDGSSAIDMQRTERELEQLGLYGSTPTIVLTQAFKGPDDSSVPPPFRRMWMQGHAELAGRSSDAIHLIAFDSGHEIQNDAPDLVTAAIREVLVAARTGNSLKPCDSRFKPFGGVCG